MPGAVLRYLRDCYDEDNRRAAVWNVFGRAIGHRAFVAERELILTGELTQLPVDAEETDPMRRAVDLYRRERELLYGSIFVVGRHAGTRDGFGGGPRTICAPLLLYPAAFVERDGFVFIEPDLEDERVNDGLLDLLCGLDDAVDLSGAMHEVVRPGTLDYGDVAAIKELLEHGIPGGCAADLLEYPNLISERALRASMRETESSPGSFRVHMASVVLLANRSRASRGVISELDTMSASRSLSAPVRSLLGEVVPQSASDGPGTIPAIPSQSQRRVIESAGTNPLTLVIGPPGTGKSFTIAALAVEHMSRGERVLIASKMDHAVSVVERIIEDHLAVRGCVVRGGPPARRRELAAYVRELLSGMHTMDAPSGRQNDGSRRRLKSLGRRIKRLEIAVARAIRNESRWSAGLDEEYGLLRGLRHRWVRERVARSRPTWEMTRELDDLETKYVAHARRHVRDTYRSRLAETLKKYRSTIGNLDAALRSRSSGRQASLFEGVDRNALFRAFPIWLVTLADIAELLPLEPELFDLVIIDEATQCDIASSLPVIQRARRCVVVGDPHQLRHISFLAAARQRALAERSGLQPDLGEDYDYRNDSLLDLADRRTRSQDQVAFLNEHFRSRPDIIRFSNERFYAGRLRIMTDHPGKNVERGLFLHRCAGARDNEGVNHLEARRLVEDVLALVRSEEDLRTDRCTSIGILSPFRSQVDALEDLLQVVIDPDHLERHRLMLGTAHTFQGEERDAMFLSLAIDDETHGAALRFLERPDIFNVAITRARTAQHIYLSADSDGLPGDSLLRAYVQQADRLAPKSLAPASLDGELAGAVARSFAEEGFDVMLRHPIAGLVLDLLVVNDRRACGVELIGHEPDGSSPLPRERYQMLMRAGLPVVPISVARWHMDRGSCIGAVRRRLEAA